jgi:hypothetical protein
VNREPEGSRAASRDRLALQQLFREVNDRLRDLALHEFDVPRTRRTTYLCECGDPDCLETVELSLDEYEILRAESGLRMVAPGHEPPGWDVIARTGRADIVAAGAVA